MQQRNDTHTPQLFIAEMDNDNPKEHTIHHGIPCVFERTADGLFQPSKGTILFGGLAGKCRASPFFAERQ